MSASSKTNRIDLRVNQEQKEVLETAASIKGISLSAYLLANCLEIARTDIAEHQKLVLSERVDAINREARNFYLKYGFVSLKDAKSSLILPIATIVASRR